MDFTSNASKRRERSCSIRTLRVLNIVCVNTLYRLDFHFIPSTHFPPLLPLCDISSASTEEFTPEGGSRRTIYNLPSGNITLRSKISLRQQYHFATQNLTAVGNIAPVLRDAVDVVPYGFSQKTATCFPLWGEWILQAKRAKDERGLSFSKFYESRLPLAFMTSIVLTSISFRQATLPTERAPFVALRHFPRFIGEICPKGESKRFCFLPIGKYNFAKQNIRQRCRFY